MVGNSVKSYHPRPLLNQEGSKSKTIDMRHTFGNRKHVLRQCRPDAMEKELCCEIGATHL